jgi:hypothetical protein
MAQVSAHHTPHSPAVVAGAMVWAYEKVLGHRPVNSTSWLFPLAQSALETAAWKQCFNNNAGNVTTANPNTDHWMYEPGNGLKFRSFSTIGDGCLVMMKWLAAHGTLAYADSGDMAGYLASLKAGCYAGCGVDYPDLTAYVTQYQSVRPIAYINMAPWQIALAASGILFGCGCVAYYIAEGELPTPQRLARAF